MKIIGCLVWIKRDWQKNKYLFTIETLYFILNMWSSMYVALNMPDVNFLALYIMYVAASTLGVIYSIARNSFPLLLTNLCYVLIEFFALYKLL
jgi:hypothetical protein